jgi:hypothetical protein
MSKKCPECGDEAPNQAHFCPNCGYDFFQDTDSQPTVLSSDGLSSNGKVFLVLIAIVIIVGAGVFIAMGLGGNSSTNTTQVDGDEIEMTITEVNGYAFDYENKTSYSLITQALFTKVPSNLEGYIIKTTYYDNNGTRIGQEIDSLSNVYSKEYSDYASSFAYFDSYKKPNPDHVTVEIEKSGKKIYNYTYEIDKSDIEFLD